MLDSERLHIRPIHPKDAEAVFAYRSDKRINRYQGWIPEQLDEVRNWIGPADSAFGEPGWSQLVLETKPSGELIGDIGIRVDDAQHFGIGYTLAKDWHGQGLATEAVAAVLDHMFHSKGMQWAVADVVLENEASIKLLDRLGFLPQADQSQTADGDERRYVMDAAHWQATRRPGTGSL